MLGSAEWRAGVEGKRSCDEINAHKGDKFWALDCGGGVEL